MKYVRSIVGWLWRSACRQLATLAMYVAVVLSCFISQRSKIVEQRAGERQLRGARRVAIFLHYDRQGGLHDYVVHYLGALRQAGYEIVFVSNAPRLRDDAWARLAPYCAVMLRRRNLGHDFGGYKDALAVVGDLSGLDELILANDSVYGPLHDLGRLLRRCDGRTAAVWSITDNWDQRYHLQSYFLLFKQPAIRHPAFAEFWRRLRFVQSRTWVIRKYEIGLTQAMQKNGLRCQALFPYRQAAAALSDAVRRQGLLGREDLPEHHRQYAARLFEAIEKGAPLNATHYFWDYLVGEMGCPFLKRDLILYNRAQIPYVSQWEPLIRQTSAYDPDLILRHLETCARNRAV